METIPEQDNQEEEEEKEQVKQKAPTKEEEEEEEEEEEVGEVKHTISSSSPHPMMGSPPPSSSTHQPNSHMDDVDSDSPPHPIDSPRRSSLSSEDSSLSHLSSPRDQPPPAERSASPPSPPAPVVSVKRSVRDGPAPGAALVAKVDRVTMDGPVAVDGTPPVREWAEEAPTTTKTGGEGGGRGGVDGRRLRPNLSILKRARRESMVRRAQLAARVCGFLFCLVAFSVMAADKDRGWAIDSFYRYKEFRYSLAVDAIGFVYSGFQAFDLARGNHHIQHQFRPYLDFSLDQILSYLLISATSSAATRVEDWQMNWGNDKFPQMATASVALTILAFLSFAVSSVISFYTLCTLRTL